jgi:hypothetical protein
MKQLEVPNGIEKNPDETEIFYDTENSGEI